MNNKKASIIALFGVLGLLGISYSFVGAYHGDTMMTEGCACKNRTGTGMTYNMALTDEQKAMMETHSAIKTKLRNNETLTTEEEATLAEMKNTGMGMGKGGHGMGMGMGKGVNFLTEEEKTSLSTMTTEEAKTFMEAKMTEQKAKRDSHEAIINKVINGETLTEAEKVVLKEIQTIRSERKDTSNVGK